MHQATGKIIRDKKGRSGIKYLACIALQELAPRIENKPILEKINNVTAEKNITLNNFNSFLNP
jgi:hypothetical protein